MNNPKSITIFLPDGNPNGIKIAELSNRNIRAILVPRIKLEESRSRIELSQPTLYILCDREGEKAYVGECENFVHRIKSHDQGKKFWEIAIVFVAKDNSLEKGDIKFLESLAIVTAKDAQRMEVMNATVPAKNNLHEFKAQTILEFFDDLQLLISTLGYPLFDKVRVEEKEESSFWYCEARATKAKAIYDENGFTVLKGSIIDGTERPSFVKAFPFALQERRQLLEAKAKSLMDGKSYELTENITFKSANKAGGFCLGSNINAWTTWKNKEGKTMDDVIRKNL